MFQKLLDKFPVLKNWRALALCAAALLLAGFLFYLWAFERGKVSCETAQLKANVVAVDLMAQANQAALGKEMAQTVLRVKNHTEIARTINDAKDEDADAPAPAIDQRFYDRLRQLDGPAH